MSDRRYPVPAGVHRAEHEAQRSRFIATLAPAATAEAARAQIEAVRAAFPDASHHAFAYVVGPPGSSANIGQGDDGEVRGTAGRPMLNVLLHAPLGDVVVVVTRYFGGTLLGKGGLVRAYTAAVQAALAGAPTRARVDLVEVTLTLGYAALPVVQRLMPAFEAQTVRVAYEAGVTLTVALPAARVEAFQAAVREARG